MTDALTDQVTGLLREVAAEAILPVFRRLDASQVTEKAPGEVVTVADRRAERLITEGLLRLLPGSRVVGEEAVAEDPGRLRLLREPGPIWLVDPLDGTANFAAGRRPFMVMVALRRDGVTEAGWILDPVEDRMAMAVTGGGARLGGSAVRIRPDLPPLDAIRGRVTSRFLPLSVTERLAAERRRFGAVLPSQHCAGAEYADLLAGRGDFVLFWRTQPWDHTAGTLLVEEAGGYARRPNGDRYDPADDGPGLLVAANERIWHRVHDILFGRSA